MTNVLLRLDGPLQSWGERARWRVRDTAHEPTKSGVVGLIACALGWGLDREDDIVKLSRSVRLGIRCDRPGIVLRDYHTVSGGAMSAQGKIKITASTRTRETVVSERFYLCDAAFVAAVQCPDDVAEAICAALAAPSWPVFLGRRSCPPAAPVLLGRVAEPDLVAALSAAPAIRGAAGPLRAVIESLEPTGVRRRDEILSLRARMYGFRYVREVLIQPPGGADVPVPIDAS